MTPRGIGILGALAWTAAWCVPALADEAKTPVSASMILEIMSTPIERHETAFNRSLKDEGPSPRTIGSDLARHVTITVKNPCPPGTAHYEPPPLPGRRVRN